MSAGDSVAFSELLMAEYQTVKEEQRARIGFRDNLLYAALGSMAGVVAATIEAGNRLQLLLLLPPVSVLLGWTYLVNDEKVSAIGRYVRDELAPKLASLTSGAEEHRVFGWEAAHRGDRRRRSRKWLQLGVDQLTFCVAPLAAAVVFWTSGEVGSALLAVSLVEVAAVAVLAVQIVLYADLGRG